MQWGFVRAPPFWPPDSIFMRLPFINFHMIIKNNCPVSAMDLKFCIQNGYSLYETEWLKRLWHFEQELHVQFLLLLNIPIIKMFLTHWYFELSLKCHFLVVVAAPIPLVVWGIITCIICFQVLAGLEGGLVSLNIGMKFSGPQEALELTCNWYQSSVFTA